MEFSIVEMKHSDHSSAATHLHPYPYASLEGRGLVNPSDRVVIRLVPSVHHLRTGLEIWDIGIFGVNEVLGAVQGQGGDGARQGVAG